MNCFIWTLTVLTLVFSMWDCGADNKACPAWSLSCYFVHAVEFKNWEQPSTQLTLSTAVKAGKEDISDFCPGQAHLKMRRGAAVGVVFSCGCFTSLLKMVYTDFCFRWFSISEVSLSDFRPSTYIRYLCWTGPLSNFSWGSFGSVTRLFSFCWDTWSP